MGNESIECDHKCMIAGICDPCLTFHDCFVLQFALLLKNSFATLRFHEQSEFEYQIFNHHYGLRRLYTRNYGLFSCLVVIMWHTRLPIWLGNVRSNNCYLNSSRMLPSWNEGDFWRLLCLSSAFQWNFNIIRQHLMKVEPAPTKPGSSLTTNLQNISLPPYGLCLRSD